MSIVGPGGAAAPPAIHLRTQTVGTTLGHSDDFSEPHVRLAPLIRRIASMIFVKYRL
jgi:hypothetical protein